MRKNEWRWTPWMVAGLLSCSLAMSPPAGAQAPEMSAEERAQMEAWTRAMTPGAPHQAMASRTGTWEGTVTWWQAPGTPPQVSQGKSVRRMVLGGRVMLDEWSGTMMGMPFEGLGETGFDNAAGRWWSTWSDNFGTGVMNGVGNCDADHTKGCTFTSTFIDPVSGKEKKSRSTVSWPSATEERMEMFDAGADGKEFRNMEIVLKQTAK
ncbi:MAG: DUF1579 family protein [Candidatus Eisenbacteria bacterium]